MQCLEGMQRINRDEFVSIELEDLVLPGKNELTVFYPICSSAINSVRGR